MRKTIRTPEDVAEHFGADLDGLEQGEGRLEALNRRLSRRLYKDTSCGAWGKLHEEIKAVGLHSTSWTAVFVNCANGVAIHSVSRSHGKVVAIKDLPWAVKTYHCIGVRDLEGSIVPIAESFKDLIDIFERENQPYQMVAVDRIRVSFKVDLPRATKKVMVFRCGSSIVEGSEAEAQPIEVILPCTPEDLDEAVNNVEDQVNEIVSSCEP